MSERLELINTLRRGHCLHQRRANICAECLSALEKLIAAAPADARDVFPEIEDVLAKHTRGGRERTTRDNIAALLDRILTLDTEHVQRMQSAEQRLAALKPATAFAISCSRSLLSREVWLNSEGPLSVSPTFDASPLVRTEPAEEPMDQKLKQLEWESTAARSAAEFARRYVRECCRHTEAVADCPHCNLRFLADYAERCADILASLVGARAPQDKE